MQKRTYHNVGKDDVKTICLPEACARYGLGKASLRKIAMDANAVVRIGKRYLVNVQRLDLYMDSISGT